MLSISAAREDICTNRPVKRYLDKVEGEVDGLLPHPNVVGDDVRHKVVFCPRRIGLLLRDVTDMTLTSRRLCVVCGCS